MVSRATAFLVLAVVLVSCDSGPAVFTIDRPAARWEQEYRIRSGIGPSGQALHLRVTGALDGTATIYVNTMKKHHPNGYATVIGPGKVTYALDEPEWWCTSCFVAYEPGTAAKGKLVVSIQIR